MNTPILKALAELEDAEKRAKNFAFRWTKPPLPDEAQSALTHAYSSGCASMRPAVEAVKVLVEAMEAIEIIGRKLDPVYIETWNAQAALAKEALADAARILGGGK